MDKPSAQGSFIVLIWGLIAKVKETIAAERLPIYPRADLVAEILLQSVMSRTRQRRLAEDASLTHRVYRFSSVDNETSPLLERRCTLNFPVR